jgi:hypothetical protein
VPAVPDNVDRNELNIVSRRVLLDALDALTAHLDAVTIVGAQAVYLRSPEVGISATASYTRDADLSLDTASLGSDPHLEDAMASANFVRYSKDHAGIWVRSERVGNETLNIPVDLLAGKGLTSGGRRSTNVDPHDSMSVLRVDGIEPAVLDNDVMEVRSLDPAAPDRFVEVKVAGQAALLVAKSFKIYQRANESGQRRLQNKDAADVLRLMRSNVGPDEVAERVQRLFADDRTAEVTKTGLGYLQELFEGAGTLGTQMAVDALSGLVDAREIELLAPAYVRELIAEIES